jgi:hypothetical protein
MFFISWTFASSREHHHDARRSMRGAMAIVDQATAAAVAFASKVAPKTMAGAAPKSTAVAQKSTTTARPQSAVNMRKVMEGATASGVVSGRPVSAGAATSEPPKFRRPEAWAAPAVTATADDSVTSYVGSDVSHDGGDSFSTEEASFTSHTTDESSVASQEMRGSHTQQLNMLQTLLDTLPHRLASALQQQRQQQQHQQQQQPPHQQQQTHYSLSTTTMAGEIDPTQLIRSQARVPPTNPTAAVREHAAITRHSPSPPTTATSFTAPRNFATRNFATVGDVDVRRPDDIGIPHSGGSGGGNPTAAVRTQSVCLFLSLTYSYFLTFTHVLSLTLYNLKSN